MVPVDRTLVKKSVLPKGVYMAFLLLHNYMDFILDATHIIQ